MASGRQSRTHGRVDYALLSGKKTSACSPKSSTEDAGGSDADQLEVLEQSLRELEIEEKTLRLQHQIKVKTHEIAAAPTHASARQPSTTPRRAKQLTDFVPMHNRSEDVELSEGVYVRKEKHIKLDSIYPAQWVVASNKILLSMWDE